jgi:hypothetical protein
VTTNDSKRLATLKSLIDIGKSQGYVVRAEAAAMLSAELLNEEQVADVLATIDDMGMFVVDDPPTAKELAAMKTPSVSATPTPAVAPPSLGPAIGAPIVVLKVGAEGGEIRRIAQELATGWRYRYSMFDQSDPLCIRA